MGTFIAVAIAVAWIKDHWILVACILVALILLIRGRSARRRQAMQAAYNAMLEQKQAAAKAAASAAAAAAPAPAPSAEPPKSAKSQHIDPPEVQGRLCLVYFYPEVEFIVPPVYEQTARRIPPLKQITLSTDDETEDIYLSYEGETFGRMRDNRLRGMIVEFNEDGYGVLAASCVWTDKPVFSLAFYESLDSIRDKWKIDDDYKEFNLTGNTNEDMQSAIGFASEGDPIHFMSDFENGKYLALVGGSEIGYCPASMNDYFDEHENIRARVLSITEKENGKYAVRVMVSPEWEGRTSTAYTMAQQQ